MKHACVLLFLIALLISCGGNKDSYKTEDIEKNTTTPQNPIPNGPKGTPDFGKDTVFNFGKIKDGEVVVHVFEVKNTGKGDLIIANVTASCGCTTPNYSKEPIKPGKTGTVKAEFNSTGKGSTEGINVVKNITVEFRNSTISNTELKIASFIYGGEDFDNPNNNTPSK